MLWRSSGRRPPTSSFSVWRHVWWGCFWMGLIQATLATLAPLYVAMPARFEWEHAFSYDEVLTKLLLASPAPSSSFYLSAKIPLLCRWVIESQEPELQEGAVDSSSGSEGWELAYLALTALNKLLTVFPKQLKQLATQSIVDESEGEGSAEDECVQLWGAVMSHLLYSHQWVRASPNKHYTFIYLKDSAASVACPASTLFPALLRMCRMVANHVPSYCWSHIDLLPRVATRLQVRLAASRLFGTYLGARDPIKLVAAGDRSQAAAKGDWIAQQLDSTTTQVFLLGKAVCRQLVSTVSSFSSPYPLFPSFRPSVLLSFFPSFFLSSLALPPPSLPPWRCLALSTVLYLSLSSSFLSFCTSTPSPFHRPLINASID